MARRATLVSALFCSTALLLLSTFANVALAKKPANLGLPEQLLLLPSGQGAEVDAARAAALASATGRLLLLYAALVGVGLGVNARLNSSTAPNHTPNAVGSAGVWSALSPRPTQDKAR